MARRSGLGRGLGALIPTNDEGISVVDTVSVDLRDSAFREVPIDEVSANTFQPRKKFDEQGLQPLADSISELGVLQPLLVREVGGSKGYELIAGERRLRASKIAGLKTVPVIVRTAEDSQSLEQALVENLHRKDLNPLDEAAAYRQLIDDFQMTHETVGTRVGKSRTSITNLLRLLQLPPKVQKHLIDESLSEGHARALLGTEDQAFQTQLADKAAKEGLSVRAVEEAVRLRNELVEPQKKVRKKTSPSNAAVLEWQEELTSRLDTRVAIAAGAKRGRIVIDFADLDDLNRLASVILGNESPVQEPDLKGKSKDKS